MIFLIAEDTAYLKLNIKKKLAANLSGIDGKINGSIRVYDEPVHLGKKINKKMPVTAYAQGGKAAQGSCLARPPNYTAELSFLFIYSLFLIAFRQSQFGSERRMCFCYCLSSFFCPFRGVVVRESNDRNFKRTFKYLDKIIFVELSTFVLPILLSSRYDVVLTYKQNLLKNMQKKNPQ